jgi:hypothetical protein
MRATLEKMLFVGSTKGNLFGKLRSVSEKQEAVNCFRKIKQITQKSYVYIYMGLLETCWRLASIGGDHVIP